MARTGALLLALTSCFVGAHAVDLKCLDIRSMLSGYLDCNIIDRPCGYGKSNLFEPWWNYGPDRTYKNRYCDKCHLERYGTDCKDNSCPHMSGPPGTAIDLLPADSETWICPRFCASMPQIPIKMDVVREISEWECIGHWIAGGCTIHNTRTDRLVRTYQLPMSTPFKTGYTEPDDDEYAVRPISQCKTQTYEYNFNSRCSCRQWQSPVMNHLNVFWPGGEAMLYTFLGTREKTQTISQCKSINDITPLFFQSEPCWIGVVPPAQQNKQFSIKPYYTYYRSRESTAALHDCRMRIIGQTDGQDKRWEDSALLPPDSEWNINRYWRNPPTYSKHFYNFKTVFDVMQGTFGEFSRREDKTIATWDFTIPCVDGDNRQQQSKKVYYAESGCNQQTCVDFITKPCYDNIYRFDAMVCALMESLGSSPIKFSQFKDKIMSSTQKESFMSYGRHEGNSYFEIWYDTAKIQVKKDSTITVNPNQPTVFTDDNTISVSLIRDASNVYSCDACFDNPGFGRLSPNDNAMKYDIIPCRLCLGYEKVQVTQSSRNYQDCVPCDPHHIRNPDKANQCRKCIEIERAKPMRRSAPYPQTDSECTTCKLFQYFDGATPQGCEFLQTVTDNIKVVDGKAKLSGMDYYIKDEIRKEIPSQKYRENIAANTSWYAELMLGSCTYSSQDTSLVKRLNFQSWCGHQEMVRHQQAFVQLVGSTWYMPLNSDAGRTRSNTTVVNLCGSADLKRVQGHNTVDLECGHHKFSIIRDGFKDPCTLCLGAKYTMNCWPTYAPGLELYDDKYFLASNKALVPQPGECAWCNKVCSDAGHYIAPVEYSCWWNGTGRVPGVLGSTPTNFSWYKQAPCLACENVQLTPDSASLVLTCGNRVSYRRWLPDDVSDSAKTPLRSIPSIQVCCAEPLTVKQCTDNELEFQTFAQQNCRQSIDDTPPVTLPYCPPGWYVDPACAQDNALWQPDCCVKCKSCRGGKFKTDAYYDCPGHEYFDSQDRGCTTSCLTNQYLRNERCIKCEACE